MSPRRVPEFAACAVALGLALQLPSVTAALAVAEGCENIVAQREMIDVFDKPSADVASMRVQKAEMPKDLCGVPTRNGRYKIVWKGRDRWVLASQFAAGPNIWEPIQPPSEGGPAGVRLGDTGPPQLPSEGGLAGVSRSLAQLPPTGVGEHGTGGLWAVTMEGAASSTGILSDRFGKMREDFQPVVVPSGGGKA